MGDYWIVRLRSDGDGTRQAILVSIQIERAWPRRFAILNRLENPRRISISGSVLAALLWLGFVRANAKANLLTRKKSASGFETFLDKRGSASRRRSFRTTKRHLRPTCSSSASQHSCWVAPRSASSSSDILVLSRRPRAAVPNWLVARLAGGMSS